MKPKDMNNVLLFVFIEKFGLTKFPEHTEYSFVTKSPGSPGFFIMGKYPSVHK